MSTSETFFIRCETLILVDVVKFFEGKPEREARGGQYLLGWTKVITNGKLDTEQCPSKDAGLLRVWIVRSHICWRGEQNIPYKDVETSL